MNIAAANKHPWLAVAKITDQYSSPGQIRSQYNERDQYLMRLSYIIQLGRANYVFILIKQCIYFRIGNSCGN